MTDKETPYGESFAFDTQTGEHVSQHRLGAGESRTLQHLADAYNEFAALPDQHPSEAIEFTTKLHDLQRMVICRAAARANRDILNCLHTAPTCMHKEELCYCGHPIAAHSYKGCLVGSCGCSSNPKGDLK